MPVSADILVHKTQKILKHCDQKNARLCIAAKTQSVQDLVHVNINPQIIFAENRVQEAEEKKEFYQKISNALHLIGPLQKNKVRKAVHLFDCIQTVDSLDLLRRIDRIAGEEKKMIQIFLSINISRDPNKSGFLLEEITILIKELKKNPHKNISITGLFTILKRDLSKAQISQFYGLMYDLFTETQKFFGPQFSEISMGMSRDYNLALEQGATIVRVGSGIFGKRV